MDCYNVQHDGGMGEKDIEDTVSDVSRIKFFKFEDGGEIPHQDFTK